MKLLPEKATAQQEPAKVQTKIDAANVTLTDTQGGRQIARVELAKHLGLGHAIEVDYTLSARGREAIGEWERPHTARSVG